MQSDQQFSRDTFYLSVRAMTVQERELPYTCFFVYNKFIPVYIYLYIYKILYIKFCI